MPALLTMMSSGPSSLTAADSARSTSPARLVSAWSPIPLPPAPIKSRAVSAALPASRSTAATRAPRPPIAGAMPRRIPEPAPVTTAPLSVSSTVLLDRGQVLHYDKCRNARPDPGLDGEGVAVAARIGAGHERAGLRVARDALPAPDHPRPVLDHVDPVSTPLERGPRLLGDARLGIHQPVAVHPHPRRLDGLLHVETELEHVEQHLRLRLEDAVGAGRADAQREGAVAEDLRRRHHGAGLAAGPQRVGRGRI